MRVRDKRFKEKVVRDKRFKEKVVRDKTGSIINGKRSIYRGDRDVAAAQKDGDHYK